MVSNLGCSSSRGGNPGRRCAHITSVPMETMDICPIFTAGVIGEGEEIILDLVNALETHQELDNIQGLIFSRNGARELTTRRPFIKDLDTLPYPAWHLLPPLDRFYRPPIFSVKQLPSTSLITSRGCSGRCTFCDRTVFGNSCRAFSAEYVVGMMTHLYQQYSIRDILIDDDNFMLFRNRLIKICRMLQAEKKPLTWSCNARVDFVDPETLNEMKKARCWQIAFGIETGSQEILDVLKKDITLEQIERSLRWTKEAGIQTKGFFMIGHPLETEKTLRKTVQFSLRTPLDDFQISYFTPLPGSEIFKGASRYGKLDRDWRKMNMWQVVFIAYGLTPETLDYYARFAFRKFYLRPRIILSYIRKSRHVVHWLALFRAGLSLLHFIFLKPNNPTTTLTEK